MLITDTGFSLKNSKLVSAIFLKKFIFDQMIALQKLWKRFFISSKKFFLSQDIQMFVFPSSPLFLPVSHCFRAWSKINLKLYDVINCLNDDVIINFMMSSTVFQTQSLLLMDKAIKNKKGLELVISHSAGYETSPEKFLY